MLVPRRGCLSCRLKKKKWYYQQLLRSHNATSAGREGNNKMTSFLAGMSCFPSERVVKVVLIKRNGIINNFCARTTPRAQRERGNYNDNTDNISASPTLLSGKRKTKIIHSKHQCWVRAEVV